MEDYRRNRIPAFGSWDYADDLPITQYFESARQAGLLYYSSGEQDLYVEGDLYSEDLRIPVRTVASRRKSKLGSERRSCPHVRDQRKQGRICNYEVTELHKPQRRAPKPVDEDLYKIPPEFLQTMPKRNKLFGFFSRCLVPTCAV